MRSERGSILILTAFALVILLGVVAIAIDASFAYEMKDQLGGVADAAAKSGALEIRRKNGANVQGFATTELAQAIAAGRAPVGSTITARLCDDPAATCAPTYQNTHYVEAIVSSISHTFFASILGVFNLTPRARAVAGISTPQSCFITMQDLTLGNAALDMNGCAVSVGGNLIGNNPNSDIVGPAGVTGTCSGGKLDLCGDPDLTTGVAPPYNPFQNLPSPNMDDLTCSTPAPGTTSLTEGCYTSIPDSVTSLGPGRYKVTGPITIASSLSGTGGVLLYLTSTASIQGNTGTLELTARNSDDAYAGIALYADAGAFIDFKNKLTMIITGAVAMMNSNVVQKNHLALVDTGCDVFVFNSFETNNGDGLAFSPNKCADLFSNASYLGVALAE